MALLAGRWYICDELLLVDIDGRQQGAGALAVESAGIFDAVHGQAPLMYLNCVP